MHALEGQIEARKQGLVEGIARAKPTAPAGSAPIGKDIEETEGSALFPFSRFY